MQETAKVSVKRVDRWIYKARKYAVFIDDERTGKIKSGELKEFSVKPGTHSLFVKAPWGASATVEFTVTANEMIELEYQDLTKVNLVLLVGSYLVFASILYLTKIELIEGVNPLYQFAFGYLSFIGTYWILSLFKFVPPLVRYQATIREK